MTSGDVLLEGPDTRTSNHYYVAGLSYFILESKPLDKIVEADLQELIDNEAREGKTIDYKRDMIGGYLIIGIDEEQGLPK